MSGRPGPAAVIERISPDDLMLLDTDVGLVPAQVGAVLVLEAGDGFDVRGAAAVIAERIASVPRLRQRLLRLPPGCGRPIWVDDARFDVTAHVRSVACEPPGDEAALLRTGAAIITTPLPWSRPLWSATLVDRLADSRVALVVVFHHVLADGIGGLAVLAGLADGAGRPEPVPFPRPRPARWPLAADMVRSRLRAMARTVTRLPRLGAALAELNPAGAIRPARSGLNRATGAARSLAVARTGLGAVRDCAHAHGATVNDVVLAAVARALREFMTEQGTDLDEVVASVMVAGGQGSRPAALGNSVGVMPIRLPTGGERGEQVARIAARTRAHKTARRGASAGLLRPAFRLLALVRLLRWAINHQRAVNIFVSNLRGPGERMRLAGAAVSEILPVGMLAGNVALSFAVMSYAGTLSVVILADPGCFPGYATLAALVGRELDALTTGTGGLGPG